MTAATVARRAPRRAAEEPTPSNGLTRALVRVVLPVFGVGLVLFVLGYAVFPTRTWLDQRAAIAERQQTLAEIEEETVALAERVTLLGTDAEIERLARIEHGLVRPGEEAYAVLPPAPEPVRLPSTWPFLGLAEILD